MAIRPITPTPQMPLRVITSLKPRFSGVPFQYESFHAHIYFDPDTQRKAETLRQSILQHFPDAKTSGLRNSPVGPHPKPMFAVDFKTADFAGITQWLMEHRNGLSVLIHPNTKDEVRDHADRPIWIGDKVNLKLDFFA